MNYSVCLDAVFNNREFLTSMEAIKNIGYNTFEFWTWWDKDLQVVKEQMDKLELNLSTMCTKFISLTDESQHDLYVQGIKDSIEAAIYLGCKTLITQVGNDTGEDRVKQHQNIVKGLSICAPLAEASGITLLVEPLNTRVDHKGYYLYSSDEAFDIIDEVNSPNVLVLFDIYHQQIMEGDLMSRITSNLDKIGHFHCANTPGRHELDSGEINYNKIFDMIEKSDYNGYVGLEYFPVNDPIVGLEQLIKHGK